MRKSNVFRKPINFEPQAKAGGDARSECSSGAPLITQIGTVLGGITLAGATAFAVKKAYSWATQGANLTNEFQKYSLKRQTELTPNVFVNTFACPNPKEPLGLPTGRHLSIKAMVAGKEVVRSYTPSEWRTPGEFDICFKVYPDGKMTNFLKNMKPGETVEIRGPTGRITYKGHGVFEHQKKKGNVEVKTEKLVLVCGGTGLTPMLQIVKHVLSDPSDKTELWLLFANSTDNDVLLYDELVELEKTHPDRLHLVLAVSRPKGEWKHHKGRLNGPAFRKFMTEGKLCAPGATVGTAICGPPSFEKAIKEALDLVGFNKQIKTMRW